MFLFLFSSLIISLRDNSLGHRGPFHLGRYSRIINTFSLLASTTITRLAFPFLYEFSFLKFSVFVSVLFVLPTSRPVTVLNMNYAIVAIGGLLVLVFSAWVLYGRGRFKGSVQTVVISGSEITNVEDGTEMSNEKYQK